jgi:hypothetical protein
MIVDTERGTGRTTKQMKDAPRGAIFISPHHAACYHDKNLAFALGRSDLTIVSPSWLIEHRWIGLELSGIVVDHAANLNEIERRELLVAQMRVR